MIQQKPTELNFENKYESQQNLTEKNIDNNSMRLNDEILNHHQTELPVDNNKNNKNNNNNNNNNNNRDFHE